MSRRRLLSRAVGALGAGLAFGLPSPVAVTGQTQAAPQVLPDPTRVPGAQSREVGDRSPFERPRRRPSALGGNSTTPHQDLDGIITPTDLHYERHHAGVPAIEPSAYTLLIHGMVERPTVLTLEDLKRFPSVSRVLFLECSGNFGGTGGTEELPAQRVCGLTSTNEWTGVPLAFLLREVGAHPDAEWFLAEAQDAAVMTRSIPIEKAWDDAIIAYGQNGEAIRPENGYPVRLICPGWEGNSNVKWLRRLELSDRPFMTREETSRYTDPLRGGKARQFSFVMDARSIITRPSYPQVLSPGWIEIRGLAWSGRGRVARTELSFDEGESWLSADLQEPILPKAHTRFRFMWKWDGQEVTILSRTVDETGYVQPTLRELIATRGPGSAYHRNPITGWRVREDGAVRYRVEAWA